MRRTDSIALYLDGTAFVEEQETPSMGSEPELSRVARGLEGYASSSAVPQTWFNYGNAGGESIKLESMTTWQKWSIKRK